MNFSERIKLFRKESNLSQDELSALLEVKRHTICDWETGRTEPSLDNLKAFARTFNISINYLIGIENEYYNKDIGFDTQMDYTSFMAETPLQEKLLQAITSCTEEQEQLIKVLLEGTKIF